MGVSQAVAFSLVAIVALSTFISMALVYQRSQDIYDSSLQGVHQAQLATDQTSIHIASVSNSADILYVNVSNNGSTNLFDFTHFAVIVDYTGNASGVPFRSVASYSYSSKNPSSYGWTSVSGIIDPSTVGQLEIILPYVAYIGTTATIIISTSYGPMAEWRGTL